MARTVYAALDDWFRRPGAYVLVDGQFGSTGKGLLAGLLALVGMTRITHCTTNAAPNSGHTAYLQVGGEEMKVVTQQVPVASVFLENLAQGRYRVDTLINAGAMVDGEILNREVAQWLDHTRVFIHPNAALIDPEDVTRDKLIVSAIAGTGKGTGPALARKVLRDPNATVEATYQPMLPETQGGFQRTWDRFWDWNKDVVFVETAQGYSLGLNSSRFYPNVTSRECSVQQALADSRIPAQMLQKVVACFRTFPIRVGNTENTSGGWYPDQVETTFEALGLEPEITTVTKRVRRIASWSRVQFRESVACNRPDVIFINFMNYLPEDKWADFMGLVELDYIAVMGRPPEAILYGTGPRSHEISVWN